MNNFINEFFCNVVIVGFYGSGKIILFESVLWVSGSVSCKGNIKDGNIVSDSSFEVKVC